MQRCIKFYSGEFMTSVNVSVKIIAINDNAWEKSI